MTDGDTNSHVNLPTHPLAPKNPQQVKPATAKTRFSGFIGDSETEGHIRIYADLTFASFYDLARSDILYATQVDELDPNSPTSVVVEGSAHVSFVHTARVEGAATFVTGEIRRDYLDDAMLLSDEGDHPTTWKCATDPPKCTGPIFCPPKTLSAF